MGFIVILILVTLSLAGTAAYFSIYGLAVIFSGVFWPVILMGGALEAGKLATASYVYRYRNSISFIMKFYLIIAVLVLMLITSAGIFGFLSMGYQQGTLSIKQQEQQITLLLYEQKELRKVKTERLLRRKQIDADIASLPNNYITGRQRLMKSYGSELNILRNDIERYTKQINEKTKKISQLKQEKLINEVHIGPIIFIARAFTTTTDEATKWMIILIMFAFDPLAVALTLGVNHAILERKKKIGYIEPSLETIEHIISEDEPTVTAINPTANISIDHLRKAITEMQQHDLTAAEMAQKGMLEELLEKKLIKEKIRNPHKKS